MARLRRAQPLLMTAPDRSVRLRRRDRLVRGEEIVTAPTDVADVGANTGRQLDVEEGAASRTVGASMPAIRVRLERLRSADQLYGQTGRGLAIVRLLDAAATIGVGRVSTADSDDDRGKEDGGGTGTRSSTAAARPWP